MQWENHIWCTLRDGSISAYTAKQWVTGWVYDVIRTDQSTGSWIYIMICFELVKVINHQCLIFGWYNSTTSAVVERKYKNYRECTAGHLLRNVTDICSITPAKLNDNRVERTSRLIIDSFTIEVTTTSLGRPRQLCPTNLLHPVNSDPSDIIRTLSGILETELSARIQTVIDIHYYLSNEQLSINRCN